MKRCSLNRTFVIAFLAAMLGFFNFGCKSSTEYITVFQPCNCPLPFSSSANGYQIPATYYNNQKISGDGSIIAYSIGEGGSSLNLLYTQSQRAVSIPLRQILPDTANWIGDAYCSYVVWCPYNPRKLYLQCGGVYRSASNLQRGYIYDLDSAHAYRVYPSKYGPLAEFGVSFWLKGSKEGLDSLFSNEGSTMNAIYVPQEDKFYSPPSSYNMDYFYQSQYTGDICTFKSGSTLQGYLNSIPIVYSQYMSNLEYVSWSPDGKKIAFSVFPTFPSTDTSGSVFEEVWILDVNSVKNPPQKIYRLNFQNLFCKYSLNGLHAEYMTDSTLAVSMHKDGDQVSPLWEITDKGKVVRQLTY